MYCYISVKIFTIFIKIDYKMLYIYGGCVMTNAILIYLLDNYFYKNACKICVYEIIKLILRTFLANYALSRAILRY